MMDTTPEVDKLYEKMLLARPPIERIQMASSMHQTAKTLALIGLRREHPEASEAELRGLFFLRFYGDDYSPEEQTRIYRRLVGSITQP